MTSARAMTLIGDSSAASSIYIFYFIESCIFCNMGSEAMGFYGIMVACFASSRRTGFTHLSLVQVLPLLCTFLNFGM